MCVQIDHQLTISLFSTRRYDSHSYSRGTHQVLTHLSFRRSALNQKKPGHKEIIRLVDLPFHAVLVPPLATLAFSTIAFLLWHVERVSAVPQTG